jgi:hypothetical protein
MPTFKEQLEETFAKIVKELKPEGRKFFKLVVLIPNSCYAPGSLTEMGGFKELDPVIYKAARGGISERDYKSILYEIINTGNEVYYAAVEYCTPLLSMYEMHKGNTARLTLDELERQRLLFTCKLTEIVEANESCRGKCLLISYADTDGMKSKEKPDRNNFELANLICERIQQDLNNAPKRLL